MNILFFSIVIPVLNRVDLIKLTLQSVFEQNFSNYEVIVVDNGSTDGTYEYCQGLAEHYKKVRVVRCLNRGAAFAKNTGIKLALGQWIVLLDSDNLLSEVCTLKKVADELNKYKNIKGLFAYSQDSYGNLLSYSRKVNTPISFNDYISINSELIPIIDSQWFKSNLHPEIDGAVIEFALMVWYPLVLNQKVVITDLVVQIYGIESDDRICLSKLDLRRSWELTQYYYMILNEFGNKILFYNKKKYLTYLIKMLIYNKISKSFSWKSLSKFKFIYLFFLVLIIPEKMVFYFVNKYKSF